MPIGMVGDLKHVVPGSNAAPPATDATLEPVIHWHTLEDDILVVHANSNGCTARSDFTLSVKAQDEDVYAVGIVRAAPDSCLEDVPWGVQLGFGFEELGVPIGSQIVLLNPLEPRPAVRREEPVANARR